MKILELFSGSGIMSEQFGENITLDVEESYKPDICIDINKISIHDLRKRMFELGVDDVDVVWASPPCQAFSVASIGTHWTGGKGAYIPKTDVAKKAIQQVKKTVQIIEELKPKYWFIENPRGVLRKLNLIGGRRVTVTYCQYGDERMKPTDIWTNHPTWQGRPMCKNGDSCHVSAPRGAKTGTQGRKNAYERSKLPLQLCQEIRGVLRG